MYKLINEDNTLVKEYPAPEIYKTISNEEKENIDIFKKEIDKITMGKGLGRVSVNVSYDGPNLQKEFILKYSNGYSYEFYDKEIDQITDYMETFSKNNGFYELFLESYILIEK